MTITQRRLLRGIACLVRLDMAAGILIAIALVVFVALR
jgi:hypothetical protein